MFVPTLWLLGGILAILFSKTTTGALQGIGILLVGFLFFSFVALDELLDAIDRNTEAKLQREQEPSEK